MIVENDEDYLRLRPRTYVTVQYKIMVYLDIKCGELFDLCDDPNEFENRWVAPSTSR